MQLENTTVACLLAGLLAGMPACQGSSVDLPVDSPESATLDEADTVVAERRMLRAGPHLTGTVQARERVRVAARISGVVREVDVEVGDKVSRGQMLARIESTRLVDTLRTARAKVRRTDEALALAEQRVNRLEQLTEQAPPAAELLAIERTARVLAQAELEQARAELASARHALLDTRVVSPLDGVVSARTVQAGEFVRPGGPLFEVIDPFNLRVEATVPASAISDLRRGMPVEFKLRTRSGESFRGSVDRIAPAIDPRSGQIAISVSIPNVRGRVLSGLPVEGRVTSDTQYVLAVPRAAVDWSGAEPRVAVVREGTITQVAVETGIVDELQGLVAIRSGLEFNERVAIGSGRFLASGTGIDLVSSLGDPKARRFEAAARPAAGSFELLGPSICDQ